MATPDTDMDVDITPSLEPGKVITTGQEHLRRLGDIVKLWNVSIDRRTSWKTDRGRLYKYKLPTLTIGVHGTTGSGKSTLINNLLDCDILPTGASGEAVTSVPIFISYHDDIDARCVIEFVDLKTWKTEIARFLDDCHLWPIVRHATLHLKVDFLETGIRLIDLPGTGDANTARERVALDYQDKADAFFIVSPITRAKDDGPTLDMVKSLSMGEFLLTNNVDKLTIICTHSDSNPETVLRDFQPEESVEWDMLSHRREAYMNKLKECKDKLCKLKLGCEGHVSAQTSRLEKEVGNWSAYLADVDKARLRISLRRHGIFHGENLNYSFLVPFRDEMIREWNRMFGQALLSDVAEDVVKLLSEALDTLASRKITSPTLQRQFDVQRRLSVSKARLSLTIAAQEFDSIVQRGRQRLHASLSEWIKEFLRSEYDEAFSFTGRGSVYLQQAHFRRFVDDNSESMFIHVWSRLSGGLDDLTGDVQKSMLRCLNNTIEQCTRSISILWDEPKKNVNYEEHREEINKIITFAEEQLARCRLASPNMAI
ncbi:hypothetical protein PUNSTDRAFT_128785 [Punctularia strigosozonata HHB-11173 SS5]|uniref:uncharacterized protein n=1 Tax=Punctularia strigosozonata (strain HHB-11173) TaxID=741275 RepID=UPI0004417FCB|nr:uncharacterized protein PUNSTDRAFT_128785 [Punctularia strigosozonata HHB-11173 SS5]EIN13103.1 hypothetical protein PUNSTDRAFT_128785 [Punctularia strigosozonata HHB-11173 SS5]